MGKRGREEGGWILPLYRPVRKATSTSRPGLSATIIIKALGHTAHEPCHARTSLLAWSPDFSAHQTMDPLALIELDWRRYR